jgi:hypothetical protein
MSLYEQNIKNLVNLKQKCPELFTNEVCASLPDWFTLPDDLEEISDAIVLWYKEHPQIKEKLRECGTDSSQRGAKGSKTQITPQEAKRLLDNIVRQSKPPSQG